MTSRATGIIASLLERYIHHGIANKKRRYKKHLAKHAAMWDSRLPKARAFPDTTAMTNISTQPQALFFSKLPLELRRLTYSYVFCNSIGELELQVAKDNNGERHLKPFELSCPTAQQYFGFPSSCKLSYVETAHLIYRLNTFLFPDITAFFCFQRLLPSRHFSHSIQSIHLKWNHAWEGKYFLEGVPPYNLEAWNRCWKQTAADMDGLKHVHVDIALGPPDYEQEFFTALVDVAQRVKMEVRVAWKTGEKEWPFTVRRGVEGLF